MGPRRGDPEVKKNFRARYAALDTKHHKLKERNKTLGAEHAALRHL